MHDDAVTCLGPVRDVLTSSARPFSVAIDSFERTATITSIMASGSIRRALIATVVSDSEEESVLPFHWLQGLLFFKSADSFIDSWNPLSSSKTDSTASVYKRAWSEACLLLLKIFDEVSRVSSQSVLGCPDLLVKRSDDSFWESRFKETISARTLGLGGIHDGHGFLDVILEATGGGRVFLPDVAVGSGCRLGRSVHADFVTRAAEKILAAFRMC